MKLNDIIAAYSPLLSRLLIESKGVQYKALFLEPNLQRIDEQNSSIAIKQIKFCYTLGIVERAHLACITSIARNARWLAAANGAVRDKNALCFSAALRGFLESCADAYDVMQYLPATLEKLFPYIYLVFIGSEKISKFMISLEKLEGQLIHYAYARRQPKGVSPLPHHTNKSNAEYIRQFEAFGVSGANTLYGELCELTHPAAASVSCFLDECATSITFNPNKDEQVIDDLLMRYEETIEQLTLLSINPALICLCYLRRLFTAYPAPLDEEMKNIGNTLSNLSALDQFVERYNIGVIDWSTFYRSLSDGVVDSQAPIC